MEAFALKTTTASGRELKATFLPEKGMNMISYKLGEIEVIDQSTNEMFEKKYGGLGSLIGPHFHRRKSHLIPKDIDETKFPHSVFFKNDKMPDPFSHGVARYAPWQVDFDDSTFHAKISGKTTWKDVPLVELEGQNFEMQYKGELTPAGLNLELSVVSDTDSIVGLHYYYALPQGKGTVFAQVQNAYLTNNEKKPLPKDWNFDPQNKLTYKLDNKGEDKEADYTLFPYPDPLNGRIVLDTSSHQLITTYESQSQENSWQLWHPKNASFVCIEPLSSQDPRHPNLTVSSIKVNLQIIGK